MGNANSNTKKNKKNNFSNDLLFKTINKISSDLILNSNNNDLLQFMNPTYCDKIINITSNILNENFTKNQLKIINNKIIKNKKKSIDSFIQNLKSIDDSIYDETVNENKKKICKEIATYYVKIVHIFSAIKNIIDKDEPICNKTEKFKYEKTNKIGDFNATVSADICNKKKGSLIKTLSDENGIPELENLYKDKYILQTKEFVMSEEQQKIYNKDVAKFYKSYTGIEKPEEIKRFSDIPIFKYNSIELCKKMEDKSRGILKGSSENDNIVNFANHLAIIMNNSRKFDKNLIEILNYLFTPDETGIDYIINENLSLKDVDDIIEKVRKIIMELYIVCDKDYRKGLKLFEKILLDKNIELAEKRLKNTNKNFNTTKNKYNENEKEKEKEKEQKYREEEYIEEFKDIERAMEKEKQILKEDNKNLLDEIGNKEEEDRDKDKELLQREKDLDIDNKSMGYIKENYNLDEANKILTDGVEKLTEKIIKKYDNNLCPNGHPLIYGTCTNDCGICDICDEEIEEGEKSYGCDICQFDICNKKHEDIAIIQAYLKTSNIENNSHMSIKTPDLKNLNNI